MTNIPHAKRFGVDMGRSKETLADYVQRVRNEKRLSLADVSARSGGGIGKTHVSRIENGLSINPSPAKLQALARGLGVSEEEIFAVARGKSPTEDPNFYKSRFGELALKFDRIPTDKRVNVEALIELLDREMERLAKK